jgi:hypothetical protein
MIPFPRNEIRNEETALRLLRNVKVSPNESVHPSGSSSNSTTGNAPHEEIAMPSATVEAPPAVRRGPLLDTEEAAARCRLAYQTMAIHRLRGTGCPYIKLGSRVFYYADELDAWIASKRRKSTSDRAAIVTP